jgi:hypothetical protein
MSNLPVPVQHLPEPVDVVDGELVGPGLVHDLCGEWHSYIDHDLIMCCGCGHAHQPDAICLPDGPCGSYLCCVN